MTGLGRAQVTRLIGRYKEDGEVKERSYERNRFAVRYTAADIELLTAVDEAHEMLSGPATQKILYREFHEYGAEEYEPLASISVPHIYNLRKSGAYRRKRIFDQKTRPVKVAIGERRRPGPQGSLRQFPFRILGFHPDNGSEFINHTVAKLLDKLLVEQTKSRPRSNDNDLVEAKNGAVIRKHLGYGHIAADHAQAIDAFYQDHFNRYLNFHRPCGVPEVVLNAEGKQKRIYRWYATPWEILRQVSDMPRNLRSGMTRAELEQMARAQSDTAAARKMQEAKHKLFAGIRQKRTA